MEFLIPALLIAVFVIAGLAFLTRKTNAKAVAERAEAEAASHAAAYPPAPEPTPAPVKGVDHLAPKSEIAKRLAAAAEAKTKAPDIPKPPFNNTYYGKQPRIARQDDTAITAQNDANIAFLALLAAQQAHPSNHDPVHDEAAAAAEAEASTKTADWPPTVGDPSDTYGLSPEDEAWAKENPQNITPMTPDELEANGYPRDFHAPNPAIDTPAEVDADVIHAPKGDEYTIVEPVDTRSNVTEEKFDYNSADNASTYNSATDNGTDSGSSSGSSYGSSDSSSSSSYDSGSSSGSSDSGGGSSD